MTCLGCVDVPRQSRKKKKKKLDMRAKLGVMLNRLRVITSAKHGNKLIENINVRFDEMKGLEIISVSKV